jgi:hypothetical protein
MFGLQFKSLWQELVAVVNTRSPLNPKLITAYECVRCLNVTSETDLPTHDDKGEEQPSHAKHSMRQLALNLYITH